jgi:hypothetical protein
VEKAGRDPVMEEPVPDLPRPEPMPSSPTFNTTAGVAVASATGIAVFGPLIGLSTAWIALGLGGALLGLTLDAAQFNGMGAHH